VPIPEEITGSANPISIWKVQAAVDRFLAVIETTPASKCHRALFQRRRCLPVRSAAKNFHRVRKRTDPASPRYRPRRVPEMKFVDLVIRPGWDVRA